MKQQNTDTPLSRKGYKSQGENSPDTAPDTGHSAMLIPTNAQLDVYIDSSFKHC